MRAGTKPYHFHVYITQSIHVRSVDSKPPRLWDSFPTPPCAFYTLVSPLGSSCNHVLRNVPPHLSKTSIETVFKRRHETAPLARQCRERRTGRDEIKRTPGTWLHRRRIASRL